MRNTQNAQQDIARSGGGAHARAPPAMSTAFVAACASAARKPPPPPREPPRKDARKPPAKKRVRPPMPVSELARKYRTDVGAAEERVLVSDDGAAAGKPEGARAERRAVADGAGVRYSRFPMSWPEAVAQLSGAVIDAVTQGHDRIRVDVLNPERISVPRTVALATAALSDEAVMLRRVCMLVDACNETLQRLFRCDDETGPDPSVAVCMCLQRATLYFNSHREADYGRRLIWPELLPQVNVAVLGDPLMLEETQSDISIIIAPCNRRGNPSHIESVELVHYSNWARQNIVIMLNPDLVALTRYVSYGDEPRQPCLLTDYLSSYFIDPIAFPSKSATGAVLRCFPRKWELYLRRAQNDMGFRLIAEQPQRPSHEKIRCEFSWRVEQDEVGM